MIKARVIADSKNEFGNRITTFVATFPRIILAELNTHRMFSRNSASSRAIPFKKMIKSVMENPFIPIAFQKDHSGMQGTEYLDPNTKCSMNDFVIALNNLFNGSEDKELLDIYIKVLDKYNPHEYTLKEWWLKTRDLALEAAVLLSLFGTTKQLCNRLVEPFMWHTAILTATEFENFFALRCPQYIIDGMQDGKDAQLIFRSRKDFLIGAESVGINYDESQMMDIDWLKINKGQAEIHMMALAEAMLEAYNESVPKELKAGEWHIPFGDYIDAASVMELFKEEYMLSEGPATSLSEFASQEGRFRKALIKIATARCARVSYTIVGEEEKEPNYDLDIKLHDRLATSGHWSPFEHCAQAMNKQEHWETYGASPHNAIGNGWSGNFKGFIQYRKTFQNENITANDTKRKS